MYGYRTKHKLLETYLKSALKSDGQIPLDHFVKMRAFCKQVAGKKDGLAAQFLLHLSLEGCFELTDIPKEHDMKVTITNKGINLGMSEYFRIKQHEFLWKAIMNILMTAATVAVAIVTIITLTKDITQLKSLEERLKRIEQLPKENREAASPNKADLQNSSPTKPKDSGIVAPDSSR